MKEQDIKLTLQETEQLCRLYMDCRLSVLEETELQYVLGKLPYSSPCIDEVRMLMGLQISQKALKSTKIKTRFWRGRYVISVAASFTILLVIGMSLFRNHSMKDRSDDSAHIYIETYSHGERLNRVEAIAATNVAMVKADSLMRYASLTDHDYIIKANNIISVTSNN